MEILASRLKQLRIEKDLTLRQLSKNLNITTATICRYENSLREPRSYALKEISDYFDVSIDYLLGKKDERKSIAYDEQDVQLMLSKIIKQLENNEGLMFDGKPITKQALEIILLSIETGIAMAQKKWMSKISSIFNQMMIVFHMVIITYIFGAYTFI